MKRQSKQFKDPFVTKALYCTLVRPTLEYCSVAWNPFYSVHVNCIESVQKQFLLFALRGLGWHDQFILPPYQDRLQLLDMESLEDRRRRSDGVYMYKLMNELIDAPYIRSNIVLNSSLYETRGRNTLIQLHHPTNYGYNEAINRLTRLYNQRTVWNVQRLNTTP